ncbi:nuclear transport factor 2 family protein [Novosphingobium sp. KACC 22771]|uniref:nuclear transport factor 2 family protein n=1 Tax=Novosphingobium sp. KACC 22771 TaxID=3025670 RepID=UPI002366E164|nr:nuclear transport factor 2 family protein [Novosphingobium sp. KACC 22771]WDF72591.1 nuclear transport factor 2 family protein [Novosphingobium sp. KACC 22771]
MHNPTADLAIRLARATFNRALEQGDLNAITAILAPDVTLITGTDSAVLNGRKAQLQAWKREFAAQLAQRTTYTRTTEAIVISKCEPIAMEHGAWQGRDAGGKVQASGSYAAKWRNLAANAPQSRWVLEAEIFVTLA